MAVAVQKKPRRAADLAEDAAAVVADLERRLRGAEAARAEFRPRRAALAFAASQGDAEAVAELEKVAIDEAASQHVLEDTRAALDEARRRLAAAREVEAVDADAVQFAAAQQIGRQVVVSAERIDRLLAELRSEIDAHDDLTIELLDTKCLPPSACFGVGSPGRLDSAVRFAGLQKMYSGNPEASSFGDETLAAADRKTVAKLERPSVVKRMRPII